MTTNTHILLGGIYRRIKRIWAYKTGVWRAVKFVYVYSGGSWRLVYKQRFDLTLTTPQTDFNLKTWFLANGWDGTSQFELVLAANTSFDASSTGVYAFDVGSGYPSGCLFTLTGNFAVRGRGGPGGAGGTTVSPFPPVAGSPGGAGGPALNIPSPGSVVPAVTIDFTQGGFLGGGGGGGGGSGTRTDNCGDPGPAGNQGSNGGSGGNGAGPGAATSGGAPGAPACGTAAQPGGNGGDFGNAGANGDPGWDNILAPPGGGAGGAPGKAINLNGGTVALVGNNSSNLRGAVS